MSSRRPSPFVTGLFVLAGTATLAFLVLIFAHVHTSARKRIKIRFGYVAGLREGAPVKVSGVEVGRVEDVSLTVQEGHPVVTVTVSVPDTIAATLRTDTSALIQTENMIGEKYIELAIPKNPGPKARPLGPDATIRGTDPVRMDLLLSKTYSILDSTDRLLSSNEKNIGALLTSSSRLMEASADFLTKNEKDVKKLMDHTAGLVERTERLLDAALVAVGDGRSLKRTLRHTDSILAEVDRQLPGLLKQTSDSLRMLRKFDGILTRKDVDRLFVTLDRVDRVLDRTLTLMDRGQTLMDMTIQGKGTVGALMVRRTLYEDLKELVRDLRENPWKMIWKD